MLLKNIKEIDFKKTIGLVRACIFCPAPEMEIDDGSLEN